MRRLVWALSVFVLACGQEAPAPPPEPEPQPEVVQETPDVTPPGIPPAPPPKYPRGLITNEPGVTDGYVLFNPLLSDTTYLVNNDGQVVHTWKTAYSPGGGMYLLPNGNLLRPGRDPAMLGFRAGGTGGILQEIAWDGSVVWEWRLSDEGAVQHHDVEPMPNGNILVLAWEVVSKEDAVAAGRRADHTPEQGLWPDWVLEIEPVRDGEGGANAVWEWHGWDHLVRAEDGSPADQPRRIDVNAGLADEGGGAPEVSAEELAQLQALGYVPADATPEDLASDLWHANSVAYHPRLDQIALSVPELGEIWIIDHGITTEEARGPAGDLLYRFGNPSAYGRGEPGQKRFFYQHDVRWVPDGWEGAGNLILFNNGRGRRDGAFSSIDEWKPPIHPDGTYALGEGKPYGPAGFAWQFTEEDPTNFFAPFISGAHRLENGNTMICSGTGGRLLEVTRDGQIVWEYRVPFSGDVRNEDGTMPQPGLDDSPFATFRATRIPADHPGLGGRTLAPLDPQPAWHETGPG